MYRKLYNKTIIEKAIQISKMNFYKQFVQDDGLQDVVVNVGDLDTDDPDFMDEIQEKKTIIIDEVSNVDVYTACENEGMF